MFDGQLDPDKDKNVNEKFSQAHGYRLGAGLKLGMISLNLEYQDLKYDKTDINQVGIFNPGYSTSNIHLNTSAWILSASFPIGLKLFYRSEKIKYPAELNNELKVKAIPVTRNLKFSFS